MSYVLCLMSYVLCLMSYVLCLMSYVLCLMSYVLCLMSYVLCLMSYVLCLMSYVLCLMSYVLCLMSYVLCLMSYVLCLMSYVLCLMSYVANVAGGLEIPLLLTFSASRENVFETMKQFMETLYDYNFTGKVMNEDSEECEIDLAIEDINDGEILEDKKGAENVAIIID